MTFTTLIQAVLSQPWWLSSLFILLPIYLLSRRNYRHWRVRNIPGPPTWPLVGNFFSFTIPIPRLHSEYLSKYGKIFGTFRGSTPVLFIAEPAIIKRIMVSDFAHFRNRIHLTSRIEGEELNLIRSRDEHWKRIRSILTPMFTSAKLRKLEPQMEQCTKALLSFLENRKRKEEISASSVMANFTMDVIATCAFATNTNAHEDADGNPFVRNARAMLNITAAHLLAILLVPSWIFTRLRDLRLPVFYVKASQFFLDLARHLIRQRRKTLGSGAKYTDMLQLMVDAEHEESPGESAHKDPELEDAAYFANIIGQKHLTEDEIVAQAIVFFLAGYDTTAKTLSFALYELAMNPDVQERLYQELQEAKQIDPGLSSQTLQSLPYLEGVLYETLRKYPPVMTLGRECNSTTGYQIPEAGGVKLYAGQVVQFPIYALHHSEEYWSDPARFDPTRFLPENRDSLVPYTYLPFGDGPRSCIGMRFAVTEAKLAIARIVERFHVVKTAKTPPKLKILVGFPLLKTEEIFVGVKCR